MQNKDMISHIKPKCFAPWIHSYVNPRGKRALCCEAKLFEEDVKTPFHSYWNSREMKTARLKMLSGELPKDYCEFCLDEESQTGKAFEMFQVSEEEVQNIIESTAEDGTYLKNPTFLDYRYSNQCNLSCRMCNPQLSSSIEKKAEELIEIEKVLKIRTDSEVFREYERLLGSGDIKRLYFATGESFIQKAHWDFLKKCVESGISAQIELSYSTNLQYSIDMFKKNIHILEAFKSVKLHISFDAEGETGEFVRNGLQWNKFVKNLEYIKSASFVDEVCLHITVTLPGLLNIDNTVRFVKSMNLNLTTAIVIPNGYAALLDPFLLSKEKLCSLLDESIRKYHNDDNPAVINLVNCLKDIRKRAEDNSNYYELEDIAIVNEYSRKLDAKFHRLTMSEYYKGFKQTKDLAESLDILYRETLEIRMNSEDFYWFQQCDAFSSQNLLIKDIVLFPQVEEVKNIREGKFIKKVFVVSFPSVMARFMNRGNSSKFEAFTFIKDNIFEKNIYKVGPFSFLFRRKKGFIKKAAKALDVLTTPFHFLLSFQAIVILK